MPGPAVGVHGLATCRAVPSLGVGWLNKLFLIGIYSFLDIIFFSLNLFSYEAKVKTEQFGGVQNLLALLGSRTSSDLADEDILEVEEAAPGGVGEEDCGDIFATGVEAGEDGTEGGGEQEEQGLVEPDKDNIRTKQWESRCEEEIEEEFDRQKWDTMNNDSDKLMSRIMCLT